MEEKLKELLDFCKEQEKASHEAAIYLEEDGHHDCSEFSSGAGYAYGTVAMTINQMIREIEKEGKEV